MPLFEFKEKIRFVLFVGSAVFIILIIYTWLHNIFSGEEGRVRKLILQGKKAVASRNILDCSDLISINYQDKYGNDRSALLYGVKEFFAYYKDIFINIENMQIKVNDTKTQAEVEVIALVIGQTQQNSKEKVLEGEKGKFKVRLFKEDKKWRVLEIEFLQPLTIMGRNIA